MDYYEAVSFLVVPDPFTWPLFIFAIICSDSDTFLAVNPSYIASYLILRRATDWVWAICSVKLQLLDVTQCIKWYVGKPFFFDGESALSCGRGEVSSMSATIRAATPPTVVTCIAEVIVWDSIPMDSASTISSVCIVSVGISSRSAGISEQGPHCSEDTSGVITRKCVLSDTGIDTGQTGGGLDFSGRTDGYKSGEEDDDMSWRNNNTAD